MVIYRSIPEKRASDCQPKKFALRRSHVEQYGAKRPVIPTAESYRVNPRPRSSQRKKALSFLHYHLGLVVVDFLQSFWLATCIDFSVDLASRDTMMPLVRHCRVTFRVAAIIHEQSEPVVYLQRTRNPSCKALARKVYWRSFVIVRPCLC